MPFDGPVDHHRWYWITDGTGTSSAPAVVVSHCSLASSPPGLWIEDEHVAHRQAREAAVGGDRGARPPCAVGDRAQGPHARGLGEDPISAASVAGALRHSLARSVTAMNSSPVPWLAMGCAVER